VLTREKILIKSVKSQILDGNYGYVRLTQFQALTAQEMQKAIADLKKQAGGSLKGMILDLRNNPGGLLDTAIQVSDAFLDTSKQASSKKELKLKMNQIAAGWSPFRTYASMHLWRWKDS
jgi:carboxyl-terminal processing protease